MIENVKLYGYLMNFMDDVIEIFMENEYSEYTDEKEYKKLRKRIEVMYIAEASYVKVWEDISPMWVEILEKLEVEKYCEEK